MTYRTPSPRPVRLRIAARTDVGPKRNVNEDGFVVTDLSSGTPADGDVYTGTLDGVAGVALAAVDGMGGSCAGDKATEIALDVFRKSFGAGTPTDDESLRRLLPTAMVDASHAILEASQKDRWYTGIAAVAVLAVLTGDRLHLASVGDSRAYLLRAGRLVQISRDDSLLNDALVMAPHLTEAELAQLPKNVVTKALGINPALTVASETFPLCEGDVLLLCSDGLSGGVDDAAIERALVDLRDPAEACLALMNLAIKAGGHDNITVVVARPESDALRPPGPRDVIESRNPPVKWADRGTG